MGSARLYSELIIPRHTSTAALVYGIIRPLEDAYMRKPGTLRGTEVPDSRGWNDGIISISEGGLRVHLK